MNRTRWFRLTVVSLLFLAAHAAAQDGGNGPSHVPIPRTNDSDPAKVFADLMGKTKFRGNLEDLVRELLKAKDGKDWQTKLAEQLANNRELKGRLQNLMRGVNPDDPAAVSQRLNGMIPPNLVKQLPPNILDQLGAMSSPRLVQEQADSTPAAQPRPKPPRDTALPNGETRPDRLAPDPQKRAARQAWAKRFTDWADRFPKDKLADPLRQSPAMQNLFRNLTQASVDALRSGGSAEGLDAQLAHWEGRWNAVRDWLPNDWATGLGERLPNLPRPNINLPNIDWSPPTFAAPSAPQFSVPAVNPSNVGSGALLVLGLALAVVVYWRWRAVRTAAPGRSWRRSIGPWPLDPEVVTTRVEVIRAFEYLSLARCGEAARSWHHRAIADRLGGTEAERRQAAVQLATLYEHARYAPAHLPEPDWTAARRPLTFLARTGAV